MRDVFSWMTGAQTGASKSWSARHKRIRDSRLVIISLSRNFGHQAAITAALDHVTGEVAVVMDGDLQDVPEVIPHFVEKYKQGQRGVCTASPAEGALVPADLLLAVLKSLSSRRSADEGYSDIGNQSERDTRQGWSASGSTNQSLLPRK